MNAPGLADRPQEPAAASRDRGAPTMIAQSQVAPASAETQAASRASAAVLVRQAIWVVCAVLAFQAAYGLSKAPYLILFYLFALVQLARASTWRLAFYPGLAVGLIIAGVQLGFFWKIFSGGAVALWLVYAFWIGLFVALARLCLPSLSQRPARNDTKGPPTLAPLPMREGEAATAAQPSARARGTVGLLGWLFIPFVWAGLEYFRSELYYLRFSWLSPALAFGFAPSQIPLAQLGAYGTSLVLMAFACIGTVVWERSRVLALVVLLLATVAMHGWGSFSQSTGTSSPAVSLNVAGVQLEFPTEKQVVLQLNDLLRRHPEVDLVVLSEYTLSGPVPDRLKTWCREHRRYLIVGGTEPSSAGKFYNTAFVVSPAGEMVFKQAKSVPIQFFKDGLPAPDQRVWESPWGRIGICICYDLSYTRVTDALIRHGAQGLIVPTMDVADWGRAQHELHARVAPVRAAEYGVPVFRLASSGISQLVDSQGRIVAQAPYPGEGSSLAGTLQLRQPGHLPLDRWLAPLGVGVAGLLVVALALRRFLARRAALETDSFAAT